MPELETFLVGEFPRTLDERTRLALPTELSQQVGEGWTQCILAKERPGCLSLWSAAEHKARLEEEVALVRHKIQLGKLRDQLGQVQRLARLLSTRQAAVQLDGRGRFTLPEGSREFLGVEPGGEVIVVGAAVCIEIWRPEAWIQYVQGQMPRFRRLLSQLSQ